MLNILRLLKDLVYILLYPLPVGRRVPVREVELILDNPPRGVVRAQEALLARRQNTRGRAAPQAVPSRLQDLFAVASARLRVVQERALRVEAPDLARKELRHVSYVSTPQTHLTRHDTYHTWYNPLLKPAPLEPRQQRVPRRDPRRPRRPPTQHHMPELPMLVHPIQHPALPALPAAPQVAPVRVRRIGVHAPVRTQRELDAAHGRQRVRRVRVEADGVRVLRRVARGVAPDGEAALQRGAERVVPLERDRGLGPALLVDPFLPDGVEGGLVDEPAGAVEGRVGVEAGGHCGWRERRMVGVCATCQGPTRWRRNYVKARDRNSASRKS